jgi:hypothetical protein
MILFGVSLSVFSQKEARARLREGNKLYGDSLFTESEIAYRKALDVDSVSSKVRYNLGNSLYKQEKYNEALQQYQVIASREKDKQALAKTWHNIGNIMMSAQDYQKSVNAYKMSLINNPGDNDTRYNLAVAQKLLKDQEQQNQDQNKDQNKDQQKEQEQQDQQDKKDQQDKQDQQNQQDRKDQQNRQDQEEQQQNQQNQQQKNRDMNREKAEQILDALSEDEKKTQNKVKEAQKIRVQRNKSSKDW